MKPRINVLYFPGTNCQVETLRVFRRVGGEPTLVFLDEVLSGLARLDTGEILCLPGGFAFGDHLGAGTVAGLALRLQLADLVRHRDDLLVLGICNGFQVAIRAGLFGSGLALGVNESGTFYDRPDQPHLVDPDNASPWLEGLGGTELRFPCAHGEGRFIYTSLGPWRPALRYPVGENPDGSMDGIAGITNADGRIFGLMNHPERGAGSADNEAIFANGIRAARG
jgi:phosphoribosylformylglycinamidine (FGAM) synthase-like amidotransferase family enzyme